MRLTLLALFAVPVLAFCAPAPLSAQDDPPSSDSPPVSDPWDALAVGDRVKITLTNGNSFTGDVRRVVADRVTLHIVSESGLSEGTMALPRARVANVLVLRKLDAAEEAAAAGEREAAREKTFREFADAASAALEKGDSATAIERARSALGLRPGDDDLRRLLAQALIHRSARLAEGNDANGAVAHAREAADLFPADPRCQAALGCSLSAARRYGEALDPLRRALTLDSQDAELYPWLAGAEYWLDDLEDAAITIERGLTVAPSSPELLSLRARVTQELQQSASMAMSASRNFQIRFKSVDDPNVGRSVLGICEGAHEEYTPVLGALPSPVRIIVHGEDEYRALVGTGWMLGHFSEAERRIHVPVKNLDQHLADVTETIRHELVHAMVDSRTSNCPRWLHEGLAQNFSGEVAAGRVERARRGLAQAVQEGKMPSLQALEAGWDANMANPDFATMFYLIAHAFVRHLMDRKGLEVVGEILKGMESGQTAESAIGAAMGAGFAEVEEEWHASLSRGGGK